ncbi:MAG: hypothetical protein HY791_13205 [Deltaproteobacteria bacterium]|nr:hypothetical protein [Deltaproteobacteria bacterium]
MRAAALLLSGVSACLAEVELSFPSVEGARTALWVRRADSATELRILDLSSSPLELAPSYGEFPSLGLAFFGPSPLDFGIDVSRPEPTLPCAMERGLRLERALASFEMGADGRWVPIDRPGLLGELFSTIEPPCPFVRARPVSLPGSAPTSNDRLKRVSFILPLPGDDHALVSASDRLYEAIGEQVELVTKTLPTGAAARIGDHFWFARDGELAETDLALNELRRIPLELGTEFTAVTLLSGGETGDGVELVGITGNQDSGPHSRSVVAFRVDVGAGVTEGHRLAASEDMERVVWISPGLAVASTGGDSLYVLRANEEPEKIAGHLLRDSSVPGRFTALRWFQGAGLFAATLVGTAVSIYSTHDPVSGTWSDPIAVPDLVYPIQDLLADGDLVYVGRKGLVGLRKDGQACGPWAVADHSLLLLQRLPNGVHLSGGYNQNEGRDTTLNRLEIVSSCRE